MNAGGMASPMRPFVCQTVTVMFFFSPFNLIYIIIVFIFLFRKQHTYVIEGWENRERKGRVISSQNL